ncbi:MAG TPA: hypothetical protein PKZ16_00445 [bacterium]|nr:hypothetical protein [bacterium]HPL95704.1 hypothetical protein [bacterium]
MFNPDKKLEIKLEVINFTDQEKEIIELIKKVGWESEEVREKITQWIDESEKEAEKTKNFSLATILFLRRRAYLYLTAGLNREFEADFNDAIEYAYQMNFDEIYNLLNEELKNKIKR